MKRLTPVAFLIALSISCSSGDDPGASLTEDASSGGATSTTSTATSSGGPGVAVDFPTGPAVLVAQDYKPRTDRIDNTGAYLPANGKPTLVFVEAIW